MVHPNVGFIGVGSMGKPMIAKLLSSGYHVKVHDKYRESAESVVLLGAEWTESPALCAIHTDVLITCLPLPHHVLENMTGENGALSMMSAGSVWIDTSTTDYHNTLRIAGIAKDKGVLSLEAPASNLSHMGIDFCNASFYVAGDREGYEKAKEVLGLMGEVSFYVGKIGEAQTIKLLTNLLYYTGTAVFGEMLIIAAKNDIPLYWVWDEMKKSSANSVAMEQFSPFLFDGSFDHSCSLEIAHKDMSLTVELGAELCVNLPLGQIIQKRYEETYNKFHPHYHVSVNKLLEEENETKLRIPNFTALSKYGANPNFVRPDGFLVDKFGRKKPKVYELYKCPDDVAEKSRRHPEWKVVVDEMIHYVTLTNAIILEEAYQLGEQMEHTRHLLREVIRWSVGTCWVSDNEDTYRKSGKAKELVLEAMAKEEFQKKYKLPILTRVLSW